MQIQGGFSSLQRIQTQQAFQQKSRVQQPQTQEFNIPDVQVPTQPKPKAGIANHLPVYEIQQIAKNAGYIGLTEADIERAYAYGESLLTDYKV